MATVTSSCSPLHGTCTIGQPYGNASSSYSCGFHTGIDFPGSGVSGSLDLYSVCSGTVVYIGNNPNASLGIQVQIQEAGSGVYYRYCHMVQGSVTVSVGQSVNTSTKVGVMGNTGNSTGTHLHLECSTTQSWNCNTFLNPGDRLGFGNTRGTVIVYDGSSPVPPTPTPASWIYQDAYNSQSEMENNANCVINFYRNQGIADATIAAILGNMQSESTIQPILNERGGGGGFGLVQWTPKTSLINHASSLGINDYNNGDNQCQVVIQEIIGSTSIREWYTTQAFISNYYNSGATSDMIGITGGQFISNSMGWTADKLAIMFMAGYERPSYDPSINHYQARMTNALNWFQYMQGVIPPSPDVPAPVGNVELRFSRFEDYYGTLYAYTNTLNEAQRQENARYIKEYFLDKDFTINPIIVVISAMDLISTLNPGFWKRGTDEAPYGLLGWRKWEFTDWVFANSEFVWDYQDPSVIDNSLGRVEWFAKYNLAWNDSNFTLEDFLKSENDTSFLAQKWIENYVYNTLTLGELLNRIDYWKRYFQGGTPAWKWLYSKKIRLT